MLKNGIKVILIIALLFLIVICFVYFKNDRAFQACEEYNLAGKQTEYEECLFDAEEQASYFWLYFWLLLYSSEFLGK